VDPTESETRTFILRVWLEETIGEAGTATWRGHITDVQSGDRRYVQDMDGIVAYLILHLQRLGVRFGLRWRASCWLARRRRRRGGVVARYAAISSACDAVVRLLQQSWRPELFDDAALTFAVYRTQDFATPMETGVSLFLYRVMVNAAQRTPPAPPAPDGRPRRTLLPLDLHFVLIPWAKDASLEQEILGWLMRTLEDTPILPAGLLNSRAPDVFRPDETVEIVAGQIGNEELFRIWDVLPTDFKLSVPYLARVVRIESELETTQAGPVLERELVFGRLRGS